MIKKRKVSAKDLEEAIEVMEWFLKNCDYRDGFNPEDAGGDIIITDDDDCFARICDNDIKAFETIYNYISRFSWKDCDEELPDKDGFYVVYGEYVGTTYMEYTKEGGWNTGYGPNGTLRTENKIDEISLWMQMPDLPFPDAE